MTKHEIDTTARALDFTRLLLNTPENEIKNLALIIHGEAESLGRVSELGPKLELLLFIQQMLANEPSEIDTLLSDETRKEKTNDDDDLR